MNKRIIDLSLIGLLLILFGFYIRADVDYAELCMYFFFVTLEIIVIFMKTKARQKIKFTPRLIRLLVVSMIIYLLFLLLSYYISNLTYTHNIFVPLIVLIMPYFMLISNLLLAPFEYVNNNLILRKNKKELDSKHIIKIAITGSYGKTTTKNFMYDLLSTKYKVYKTPKNYNTLFGVSNCVKELTNEDVFIVEMGARHKKDIKKLCKFVDPDIGVLTGIGMQHLDTFKNIDNICSTKYELVEYLQNKPVFFNKDNKYLLNMYKNLNSKNKFIDLENLRVEVVDKTFSSTKIMLEDIEKRIIAVVNVIGDHIISDLILAIKVAYFLGVSIDDIKEGLQKIGYSENRFNVKYLNNDIVLIDDTYNCNLDGAIAALNFLGDQKDRRKIVYTQGIVEAGKNQYSFNYTIGKKISEVADIVIVLGVNSKAIIDGINSSEHNINIIEIKSFKDSEYVLKGNLKKGDCLLIQNDLTDNYL